MSQILDPSPAARAGSDGDLLARRRQVLGPHTPLFYDRPLRLVRGAGCWVYDAEGRAYLDAYNNVPHVGHCHPRVVDAITAQAATLNLHTRYLHEGVVAYGERLLKRFDPRLSKVLFCCTGTEANELALRLARLRTGAAGIIVSSFSYHGHSQALASLTTAFPTPEAFPSHARTFAAPDTFRDPVPPEALAARLTRDVEDAIASMDRQGVRLAALLVDSSLSSEGLPELSALTFAGASEAVRKAGGLVIADEVQAGFGRMGDRFWSYEAAGLVPDLVTLGKPMGNGFPIAAVVAPADIVADFGPSYFNTFAGNPVAAAAADAMLDVLESEDLQTRARRVGARLKAELQGLQRRHATLGDVRGRGLYLAAEVVDPEDGRSPDPVRAHRLVNLLREGGVLVGRVGPHDNVLKIRPPMAFAQAEADQLTAAFDAGLARL